MLLLLLLIAVYSCVAMTEQDNTGGGVNVGLSAYFEMFIFVVCIPYLFFLLPEIRKIPRAHPLLISWMWYFLCVSVLLVFLPTNANYKGHIVMVCHNLMHLFVMYAAYLYVKRNGLSNLFLTTCFGAMLIMVAQYFRIYSIANEVYSAHIGVAYYPLFLLPILMLHPWKSIRYLSVIIVMVVLFSSIKRGGLLAFALGILIYLFAQANVSREKKIRAYVSLIIALTLLLVAFIWLGTQDGVYIFERFMNIQNDGGSNRDIVWNITWNMIMQSDLINFLLGHGANAVVRDSHLFLSAHNDILEVWYDYGLIVLLLLLIACYKWLSTSFHLQKQHHYIAPSMLMLGGIVAILMMISHVIIYQWMILVVFSLGVYAGIVDREKEITLYAK